MPPERTPDQRAPEYTGRLAAGGRLEASIALCKQDLSICLSTPPGFTPSCNPDLSREPARENRPEKTGLHGSARGPEGPASPEISRRNLDVSGVGHYRGYPREATRGGGTAPRCEEPLLPFGDPGRIGHGSHSVTGGLVSECTPSASWMCEQDVDNPRSARHIGGPPPPTAPVPGPASSSAS